MKKLGPGSHGTHAWNRCGICQHHNPGRGGAVMLTPEQRAAVRSMIRARLSPDELREKLADRLAGTA